MDNNSYDENSDECNTAHDDGRYNKLIHGNKNGLFHNNRDGYSYH